MGVAIIIEGMNIFYMGVIQIWSALGSHSRPILKYGQGQMLVFKVFQLLVTKTTPPSWTPLPKPRSDASAGKINSSLDQPISSCCIVPADADFFNAKLKLFKYKQTF